jgi:outer membrane protein
MGVSSKYAWLFCIAALPAAAPAAVLTFQEATALAVQHNATLRNAHANVAAAEQRRRAAYSGFFPQISGDVSYVDRSGSDIPPTITSTSDYSTSVTVTQNLFAGFEDEARVEQGAANVDIAEAALNATKAQLSSDVKTAFAGLLYAQDNVTLTENILRRLEENLRLVELRFEGGRENKGSLLLSQASVAQGRFDRLQAQQALTSAQARLAAVIGQATPLGRDAVGPVSRVATANEVIPPSRVATANEVIPPSRVAAANAVARDRVVPDLFAVGAVPLQPPPVGPDYAALMRNAPGLRDAIARQRSAEADVRLARAGFYPTVSVSGTVGRDGSSWFPNNDSNVVSANVSIPLYSGGRDYYGERGALAALDAVKADREGVEGQLLVQLKQSYAAYVESVEQLKIAAQFVTAAETRATIARARYQNGLISFEDWDRIENDLILRRKALLAAQRDRVNAEAAWELAQGSGVIP